MDFKFIKYEVKDGVAKITINHPPVNVLDIPTMSEMCEALDDARKRSDKKVVVVTSEGTKAFSAGVDVRDHTPDKMDKMLEVFHGVIRRLWNMDVPTVSLVKGVALGGGCEVAVTCDMVLAADNAKFGQPEIKVGVYPSMVVAFLHKVTFWKKAFEIIYLGENIDAQEAYRIGLVNHVYPLDSFEEEVEKFIKGLTEKSGAVLRWAKRAVMEGLETYFLKGLELSEIIYAKGLMSTHDAEEGLKAFMEKRAPKWEDR